MVRHRHRLSQQGFDDPASRIIFAEPAMAAAATMAASTAAATAAAGPGGQPARGYPPAAPDGARHGGERHDPGSDPQHPNAHVRGSGRSAETVDLYG